MNSAYNLSLRS